MSIKRPIVKTDGGLMEMVRTGFGILSSMLPSSDLSADANGTITATMTTDGLVTRIAGATAGRTDTSDTGTNFDAMYTNADFGDSFEFIYSNQSTQTITLAGGTGVTAAGNLLVPTLTHKHVIMQRTAVGTWTMTAL